MIAQGVYLTHVHTPHTQESCVRLWGKPLSYANIIKPRNKN